MSDFLQSLFTLLFIAVALGALMSIACGLAWIGEHTEDLRARWIRFKFAFTAWNERRIQRRVRRRLRRDVFHTHSSSFWGKA